MKTLKKTLCLVLAVVMAVGVLILPANAAGYDDMTDTDKINPNYAEAVETLTGMGIISGKASGTTTKFDPKGTLLRQEAAIMIVNVMMKAEDKPVELAGYADKFTDIAGADVYARKEINYLATKGIVSGKDAEAKLFKPHDTLTTYELLTMLRKVAEIKNGYVTEVNEWTAQATKFADDYNAFAVKDLKESLFENLNQTPTREEAAQLIFSVITCETNANATGTYTVTVGTGANKKTFPGVSLEQAMMLSVVYSDAVVTADGVGGSTIGKNVYGLTDDILYDPYGRPFYAWFNGYKNQYNEIFSDFELDYVDYTDQTVTLDKIFNTDLKITYPGDEGEEAITILTYKDGEAGNPMELTKDEVKAKEDKFGGRGVALEVYNPAEDVYIIVEIPTHVAVIKDDAKDGKYFIEGDKTSNDTADDITVSAEDYDKGDVVLYTKGKTHYGVKTPYVVSEVQLASAATGYVSHKSNNATEDYFRLNAETTKYYIAEEAEANLFAGVAVQKSTDDARTFWVDARGNVFSAYDPSYVPPVPKAPNYIYVIEYDQYVHASGSGLYENANTVAEAGARIKYLDLNTGTVGLADLAVVHGTGANAEKWYLADNSGNATSTEVTAGNKTTIANGFTSKFVSYKSTSKGWVLNTEVESADVASYTDALKLSKGTSVINVGGKNLHANNDTSLVLLKQNTNGSYTATPVTGYKSFVNVNGTEETGRYTASKTLVVTSRGTDKQLVTNIYVIYTSAVSAQPAKNYGIFLGAGEQSADGYSYNFLVNGEVVTYSTTKSDVVTTLSATTAVNTVYELKFGTDGAISGLEGVASTLTHKVENKNVVLIDSTTIIVNGTQYAVASDAVIYDITGSAAKLDTTLDKAVAAVTATDSKVDMTVYCLGSGTDATTTVTLIVLKTTNAG